MSHYMGCTRLFLQIMTGIQLSHRLSLSLALSLSPLSLLHIHMHAQASLFVCVHERVHACVCVNAINVCFTNLHFNISPITVHALLKQ